MDALLRRYRGYSLDGIGCKIKYIVNRIVHLPFRWLHRDYYLSMAWYRTPFNLSRCVFVSPEGYKFTCHTWEVHLALGLHEPHILRLLGDYLGPGSVFIDVGAHIGTYTVRASKIVGEKGLVIAFEPDYRNYYNLVTNLQLNKCTNVVPVPLAAYSRDGVILEFMLATGTGHSSLIHLSRRELLYKLPVYTVTVDTIVRQVRPKTVDLVKIDTEGAEVEVLRGMRRTIERYQPVLIIETHGEEQYKLLPSLLEGYRLRELTMAYINPWNRHVLAEPVR